jgi:hypothetical protein
MVNKQTAVDWFLDQVKFIDKEVYAELYNQSLEQAKQMEKEQIKNAFDEGFKYDIHNGGGEQYYNETYGNITD